MNDAPTSAANPAVPGDELPLNRFEFNQKVGPRPSHPGVTGKVRFVKKGENDYTGIFQGGLMADYGLIHLSSAKRPFKLGNLSPCMALKFLRGEHDDSANLAAMVGLNGQPDNRNFFGDDSMSTEIKSTFAMDARLAVSKVIGDPWYPLPNDLSKFANIDNDGNKIKHPKFPYALRF